jgi:rod shape-determining protein MreD
VVFVSRFLLGLELEWMWYTVLYTAIGNSMIALILFPVLDHLQVHD